MTVTSTAATISQAIRSSSSSATCRARSWTTSSRASARLTPSRRISSTRAFDTRWSAASMAAKTPASGIRQIATTSRVIAPELIGGPTPGSRRGAGHRFTGRGTPALDQLLLETEHLLLLVRLHVVVAEEVQDAVRGQQHQFVVHGVAGGAGLADGDGGAEHDVTEQGRAGLGVVGAGGVQLVHGEGQDVGRALLPHPALVQRAHVLDVDAQHRQLGHRVDLHLAEHEPADAGELGLVDGDLGLVGHLDGHAGQLPCRRAAGRPDRRAGRRARRAAGWRPSARRRRRCRRPAGDGRRRSWSGWRSARPRCRRGSRGRSAARSARRRAGRPG